MGEADSLVNELIKWTEETRTTQSELARLIGVDRRRINEWFSGKKHPTLNNGIKIQRFLKEHRRRQK
jgi:DNA-binding XRE family transcriptional regulator